MKISHEFPLQFYLNGVAESLTDYDYCLVHRYIENKEYKDYMRGQVAKGRTVYLDNSLYELGKAWNDREYAKIIEELKPTCYMLPDVFNDCEANIKSQVEFYEKYKFLESTPIAIPHASSMTEMILATHKLCKVMSPEVMIAIPFADKSFKNDQRLSGRYFKPEDVPYIPLRQALNRKVFLEVMASELKTRKVHLLGCKSLEEFSLWKSLKSYDKSFVVSVDTSHPVAMTLETKETALLRNTYEGISEGDYLTGTFTSTTRAQDFEGVEAKEIKMPMSVYKPIYLIDKHFEDHFDMTNVLPRLNKNVEYFREKIREWEMS